MLDQVRLTWRLYRDPRVASRLKSAIPLLAAAYLISPVDLLPDIILGLGQLDDLGVLGLAIVMMTRLVPRFAPDAIVQEHLAEMGRSRSTHSKPNEASGSRGVVDAAYRVRQ
jgi:uncharacterized membrane protein YkvA (DUF1232 family)